MQKSIDTFCEVCDSEFAINFDENLVSEHEEIFCPFCGFRIEEIEEESLEEELFDKQNDMWD